MSTNQVSRNDDFFQLGGNSVLAIRLLFKLEQYLNITIADVFKLRTPEKIAKYLPPAKNQLKNKCDDIIRLYHSKSYAKRDYKFESTDPSITLKHQRYIEEIKKIIINNDLKKIENVLLTGATGYLGCHILEKLLSETPYKIYLLIRADSIESAINRITQIINFY